MPSFHGATKRRHAPDKFHLQPLERLRQDTRKSVWYAFDTLANSDGKVAKSQLKVLTSTIGMVLGFDKSEEILNKDMSTNELGFHEYLKLLETEIFDHLSNLSMETLKLSNDDLEQVHRNCWLLFLKLKKDPQGSLENLKMLPEDISYQLWRIFNFLAEEEESGVPLLPLRLDKEEAEILFNCFVETTGQVSQLSEIKPFLDGFSDGCLSFQQLERAVVDKFAKDLSDAEIKKTVKDLFEKFIGDTLLKGMMCKCGHVVKSWKDRWMVLTSKELLYYTAVDEKDKKGTVPLSPKCKVEIAPEKPGARPNRFILRTPQKPYEMSAADLKTRNDWMTALQKVINKSEEGDFHFHRQDVTERRQRRIAKRRQLEEEERKKKEEAENLKKMMEQYDDRLRKDEEQLLEQRKALEEAERARLELEERLRKEEELRKELERLLELERQAKRDEEIVRALQARLLEEEYEKREELERLKAEQENLLQREREKRENLEGEKQAQIKKLQDAESMLGQLKADREAAEARLTEASDKLKTAEKERQIAQEKVKLWRTPVGLAKPVIPKDNPLVTHRGQGAFCDADFEQGAKQRQLKVPPKPARRPDKDKESNKQGSADTVLSDTLEADKVQESEIEINHSSSSRPSAEDNSKDVSSSNSVDKVELHESGEVAEETSKSGNLPLGQKTAELKEIAAMEEITESGDLPLRVGEETAEPKETAAAFDSSLDSSEPSNHTSNVPENECLEKHPNDISGTATESEIGTNLIEGKHSEELVEQSDDASVTDSGLICTDEKSEIEKSFSELVKESSEKETNINTRDSSADVISETKQEEDTEVNQGNRAGSGASLETFNRKSDELETVSASSLTSSGTGVSDEVKEQLETENTFMEDKEAKLISISENISYTNEESLNTIGIGDQVYENVDIDVTVSGDALPNSSDVPYITTISLPSNDINISQGDTKVSVDTYVQEDGSEENQSSTESLETERTKVEENDSMCDPLQALKDELKIAQEMTK